MSLVTKAYFRDDKGDLHFLEESEATSDVAGFEAYRTGFYGSERVRSLGFKILPRLAKEDVYAEGEELLALEKEVKSLMARLSDAMSVPPGDPRVVDKYKSRLQNILAVIRVAKAHPSERGGVYIG